MTDARYVLFVCVHNTGRSMMAEAIFNASAPPGWSARSAGTAPGGSAHPRTVSMLREMGLEPPPHAPRPLEPDEMLHAVIRVTMGCLDDASCPARLRELPLRDWGLDDPSRLDDAGFRRVRGEIQARVAELIREISEGAPRRAPEAPSRV